VSLLVACLASAVAAGAAPSRIGRSLGGLRQCLTSNCLAIFGPWPCSH